MAKGVGAGLKEYSLNFFQPSAKGLCATATRAIYGDILAVSIIMLAWSAKARFI